jgi:hypothetical protein
MGSVGNFLKHPKILLPKNFKEIPENWLELEILALLKYPSVLTRFELYNEQNERLCICKFIENYSNPASINGYFSRPVFRNYHNETFGTMKYLGRS